MAGRPAGDFDTVIVGQGLAGSTLAWQLRAAGERVLLIDAGEPTTSSGIAAGLLTPITGRQLKLSPTYGAERAAAEAFYAHIETVTGRQFFTARRAIRLLASAAEQQKWTARVAATADVLRDAPLPLLEPEIADPGFGGFVMAAAQLDTAAFLAASATTFAVVRHHLDWRRDIAFDHGSVRVLGRLARRVVSAEGYAAARNPYFDWVPFRAAKGELLTIEVERPLPDAVIHSGIWIAPTGLARHYKVGATFAWDRLDDTPTAEGRAELETRLAGVLRRPYRVVAHAAAVRPIIRRGTPVMGAHPRQPGLFYFNGLASKGALRAPAAARRLAEHICHGTPLDEGEDVSVFASRCPA